jgi:hypothetical protein
MAGLLYHVFSPLHLLSYARSITRKGGIVVVETAAMKRSDYTMQYNFDGERYLYDWTDTWFPSLPLLDYALRSAKLQPIDAVWVADSCYPDLIRVGVACRVVDEVIAEPTKRSWSARPEASITTSSQTFPATPAISRRFSLLPAAIGLRSGRMA